MPLEISWIVNRRHTRFECVLFELKVLFMFSLCVIYLQTEMRKFHTMQFDWHLYSIFHAWWLGKSHKSSKFDASKWQPYKSSLILFDLPYKTIYITVMKQYWWLFVAVCFSYYRISNDCGFANSNKHITTTIHTQTHSNSNTNIMETDRQEYTTDSFGFSCCAKHESTH